MKMFGIFSYFTANSGFYDSFDAFHDDFIGERRHDTGFHFTGATVNRLIFVWSSLLLKIASCFVPQSDSQGVQIRLGAVDASRFGTLNSLATVVDISIDHRMVRICHIDVDKGKIGARVLKLCSLNKELIASNWTLAFILSWSESF